MPDREKVINGLRCIKGDLILCVDCAYSDENGHGTYSCKAFCANDAIAMLKEQNWIKCSDEMPEEHETIFAKFKGTEKWSPAMFAQNSDDVRVVVAFADGTRRVSHSHTNDGKWECEKSPVKRTVTHWMPNPELPNEGR